MPDDPSEELPVDDDLPLLRSLGGWPRDLLSWVVAIPPLLYLGAVAAGFVGFSTFVILLLITEEPFSSGFFAIVTAIATWYWWAREHFGVTRERILFYRDGVVATLRVTDPNNKKLVHDEEYRLGYDELGTISLHARESSIRIRFGLASPYRRSAFQIKLPRLTFRDQFDEILEWIETAVPDHLYLAESDEAKEYSRPWTFEEVFRDVRSLEGTVTLDRLGSHSRIVAGDQEYRMVFEGFSRARINCIEDLKSPIIAAVCDHATAQVPVVRVYAKYGLEIGSFRLVVRSNRTEISFGWGETITWNTVDGTVERGGETFGKLVRHGDGAALHLDGRLSEPHVLVLFLMIGYFPQLVESAGKLCPPLPG